VKNVQRYFQAKLTANFRPLKVAYFISNDDAVAFREVVRLCCTQWGGIRNLIVPVHGQQGVLPIFDVIIRAVEPDIFVSYLADSAELRDDGQSLLVHIRELLPERRIGLRTGKLFGDLDRSVHAVYAAQPADVQLIDNPRHERGDLLRPPLVARRFVGEERDQLALLAIFGAIYPGQEGFYASQVAMAEEEIGFRSDNIWLMQRDDRPSASILNLTASGIDFAEAQTTMDDITFNVVVTEGLRGLCLFWDFRAHREAAKIFQESRRTMLLPRWIAKEDGVKQLVKLIRHSQPIPNATCSLDINFSPDEEEDKTIIEEKMRLIPKSRQVTGKIEQGNWSGQPNRVPREADPNREIVFAFIELQLMNFPTASLSGVFL
jgi:hypothetical protein